MSVPSWVITDSAEAGNTVDEPISAADKTTTIPIRPGNNRRAITGFSRPSRELITLAPQNAPDSNLSKSISQFGFNVNGNLNNSVFFLLAGADVRNEAETSDFPRESPFSTLTRGARSIELPSPHTNQIAG